MKLGTGGVQKKPQPGRLAVNIFAEAMQAEEKAETERKKKELHPHVQVNVSVSKGEQEQMDRLQNEDKTVFQYDELLDDKTASVRQASQKGPTEGLEQKKRIGLFVPAGGPKVDGRSNYIEKLQKVMERREIEKEIIEQRVINRERKKDQELFGEKEVFVTSAYKERLKERKQFEVEMLEKDRVDAARDAAKMEHGLGFAALHRTFLDREDAQHAAGVGGYEKAGPSVAKQEVKEEVTETAASELQRDPKTKKEEVKEEIKDEEQEAKVAPPPSKKLKQLTAEEEEAARQEQEALKAREKVEREDKAKSARERYLARKKAAAE